MKLVVLTNMGSFFGLKLLNELREGNIIVEAIVVIKQPFNYYLRLFNYVKKKIGLEDAIYFSIKRIAHGLVSKPPEFWRDRPFLLDYNKLAASVFVSNGTNSSDTVCILKKSAPDLVLLGQTGVVKKNVVDIPHLGTLNAHPGILPFYRGIDCAKWAILNDDLDEIGATVHWVDEGVDTGPIIAVKKYSLMGDETLEILEERLEDMSIQLMISIVSDIVSGKRADGISQDISQGQQCYKMGLRYEKMVRKKVARLIGAV